MKMLGVSYTVPQKTGTEVHVAVDGSYAGYILISDVIKPNARAAVAGLKAAGVRQVINDAPVLSRADIGIAMGALGSDAAIEAADIVLMDDDPAKIATAMNISRKTLGIVHQNIVFALAVKFACLGLGAFGFVNMWWAIFADVGVMIIAVLNATRTLKSGREVIPCLLDASSQQFLSSYCTDGTSNSKIYRRKF